MTEDAKKTKAKNDANAIAKAIHKFNTMDGTECERLGDLKGKYLSNIDSLRDPWGQEYGMDPVYGMVYCKGPDGRHSQVRDKSWDDDITADYAGALNLIEVRLEIDPDPSTDETTANDRLYLYFNKAVTTASASVDLGPDTAAAQDRGAYAENQDADARDGKIFRWYEGIRPGFTPGQSPFPAGTSCSVLPQDNQRLVVLVFPPGFTEVFQMTTWLNLTGARKNPNPWFLSLGGGKGAEATGRAVVIQPLESGGIPIPEP